MSDINMPMEADVTPVENSRGQTAADRTQDYFYGTSVPAKKKKKHTALIVCLCAATVIAASAAAVFGLPALRGARRDGPADRETQNELAQMPQRLAAGESIPPETASGLQPGATLWKPSAPGDGLCGSVAEAYEAVSPGIVCVTCRTFQGDRHGSGTVLSEDGYILCAAEVTGDSTGITVTFSDGGTADAALVGTDPDSGLCVLKAEVSGLCVPRFSESVTCRVGDTVLAIENPYGGQMRNVLSQGIVSGIGSADGKSVILTGIPFSGNAAGCAIAGLNGEIIGVVCSTGIASRSAALCAADVRQAVERILRDCGPSGWLGFHVEAIDPRYAEYYRLPGTLAVTDVEEGTFAAGYLRSGNVIVSVDGTDVTTVAGFNELVQKHSIGDIVTVVFYARGFMNYLYSLNLPVISRGG